METTKLSFTKQTGDSAYVCKITPSAEDGLSGVVQIEQVERGIVSVSANIPDMPPALVRTIDNPFGKSLIFELALPAGIEVTIKSATEVTNALWTK